MNVERKHTQSQSVLKVTRVFPSSVCETSLAGPVSQFAATKKVGALASLSHTLPFFSLCWFWSWLDSCMTGIQCTKLAENKKWITFHHHTEMNWLSRDLSGWQEQDHPKGSRSKGLGQLFSVRELDRLLLSSLITPKGLGFFAGTLNKQLCWVFLGFLQLGYSGYLC